MEKEKNRINLEPKLKNRWVIEFNKNINIDSWLIKTSERPSMLLNDNDKMEYKPIKITFSDCVSPSTTHELYKIMDGLNSRNIKNNFNYELKLLGPTGIIIETWVVNNFKIIEIVLGELDYSDSSLIEPFIVIESQDIKLI